MWILIAAAIAYKIAFAVFPSLPEEKHLLTLKDKMQIFAFGVGLIWIMKSCT